MPTDSTMHLSLLGSLEAVNRSPDGERRLGKGKPVAMLAFLALAPGRRASRERLATLLWSEGSTEAARQNLRQTMWYLKRRLGEVIIADDDTVTLGAGTTSDVEEFIATATAERFAEAEAGYGGDFVPEFAAPGAAAFEVTDTAAATALVISLRARRRRFQCAPREQAPGPQGTR